MKNKKLIGHVGVLALALMGILGVAGFAAASDGNTNTPVTGDLSGKGALTIIASGTGTIIDASGNEVNIPSSGSLVLESQANLDCTMIDVSDTSKLEGSGTITVSTNGTIVDDLGNQVDAPLSGALSLNGYAGTETLPTK
jgi:hypothetical protein